MKKLTPKANPGPAIKIDRVLEEGKCYVCGRQTSAVVDLFNLTALKDEIARNLEERYKDARSRIDSFAASLKNLLDETRAYRGDLTTRELRENKSITSKIAPKFDELAKFAMMEPKTPYDKPLMKDCTIDAIRKNIEALINEIGRGDYARVVKFRPDLVKAVETFMFDQATFKPELNPSKGLYSYTTTYHFDLGGHLLFARRDEYSRRFTSYHRYITVAGKTHISEEKMDVDNVIKLTYHYSICQFCSSLFYDASNASYGVIHAHDHDYDD